jgi:long-chain acyl-CoA synthetase
MLTHANVFSNVHNFNYWMSYREGGVYLHVAPIFHIADFPAMFAAPAFGACQVTLPEFNAQALCEIIANEKVTHTVMVPTMINLLTQSPEINRYDLRSIEVLAYGGSPVAPEVIRRTRAILPGARLVQVYGLSETGFLTGLRDQEHTPERLTSCGRPCPGIDLQVVNEAGGSLATGQHGEVVVRGANVMSGYWKDVEDSSIAFQNKFFRTGDIGYQDTAGYLYLVDRIKDMIITGGEKVFCSEVESVLYEIPVVLEATVFGIPDSRWGETVMACVALKPHCAVSEQELVQFCRERLSPYKIPRRVEFFETELPKSASGKILKRVLRERFWGDKQRAIG